MSLELLTSTNFYAYSGLSASDINTSYLTLLLEQLNGLIDTELEQVFSYNNLIADYYRDNASRVVIVGTWQPPNRVVEITVTNGGSGYTSIPTVTVNGGTPAVVATAEATISEGGEVTTIKIVSPGDGYVTTPTIEITGGEGSNATATATLSTLTVELGQDNGTIEELTVAEDFRYLFIGERRTPYRTQPFGAILLYRSGLSFSHFIRLTGTYGAYEVIPKELLLEAQLYDILKKAVLAAQNETESGGKGIVRSSRIDRVSVTFGQGGTGSFDSSVWSTKDTLEIAQGVIGYVKRKYEYNQNYFNAVIG